MLCEAGQENGAGMKSNSETLPVVIKLSALSVGSPLVLLGLSLLVSDLSEIMRRRTLLAAPHSGLTFGPMCVIVGLSFLWPLRIHSLR
jgi:hypothetical protein